MMMTSEKSDDLIAKEFCKTSNWYGALSNYTFPTSFVKLKPLEIQALADGITTGKAVSEAIERLSTPMELYPGNCFVFVDCAAPTDTERYAGKRGAVHSPQSAWKFLAMSAKVRNAVASGSSEHICVRPFRRITRAREFRLFIYKGRLAAMSQYWLTRHYRRLAGVKQKYYEKAKSFVESIAWLLPVHTLTMDIYFTSRKEILIIDLNPWGPPTSPLLLKSWERDWNVDSGIVLIGPPTTISGDVNVSF